MALNTAPGDPLADSYASVAEADAYHTDQGSTGWTGDVTAKEAALRRATLWIDGRYRTRFPGLKANGRSQALEWPRSGACDYDGNAVPADEIPREVVLATLEAALREAITPDSLTPDYVASKVKTREKIDVLEFQYDVSGGVDSVKPVLTKVDGILGPLITTISIPIFAV